MTRTIYPDQLHALENNRHELVVDKLHVEHELRQIKDRIRDARDRCADMSELTKERDELLSELHQITIELAELQQSRSRAVLSYKTAFLKMAKKILPRDVYREVALAATDFIRVRQSQSQASEE